MIKHFLKVHTTESRVVMFYFSEKEYPYSKLASQAIHLIKRCCTHSFANIMLHEQSGSGTTSTPAPTQNTNTKDKDYRGSITELGKLWEKIYALGAHMVDGQSSSEGPPHIRIFQRLATRAINRTNERRFFINHQKELLAVVRGRYPSSFLFSFLFSVVHSPITYNT